MTNHRNWALMTASVILIITAWSGWHYYKLKTVTITFIMMLLITQGLLLATAWRGSELVFHYGLGVMSLPKAEEKGGHHHSEEIIDHSSDSLVLPSMKHHNEHYHAK
jgi:hypothetical protein